MNTACKWAWYRWFGVAALAVASGTAGWALGRAHDTRDPAPARNFDSRVAAESHISATRRFDAGTQTSADTVVVREPYCEPTDEDRVVVDAELLERILVEGTESERHGALTRALETGIELAPELLQRTYLNDSSEGVRLLAFTTYVDAVSEDRTEVRDALQGGVYDSSSAVQAEAQRRLAELEQYERVLAEIPQGLP